MKANIIKTIPGDENTEVRVTEIESGFAVGIYDLDIGEAPFGLNIFNKLSDALAKADDLSS